MIFFLIIYSFTSTGGFLATNNDEDTLSHQTLRELKNLLKCKNRNFEPRYQLRSGHWVLYDYIRAGHGDIDCHEMVTLVTHGDFTFMDHLIQTVNKWRNPVSLTLFAPGDDFNLTLSSIRYVRDCSGSDLIKTYVTFHLFFPCDHRPEIMPNITAIINQPYDCSVPKPYSSDPKISYRNKMNLMYPINMARNIAKESALTHFHFVVDIELYPSPHLPMKFLNMIARNEPPLNNTNPRVFVLSLFEVEKNQQVPSTKAELSEMLQKGVAIPFHRNICPPCHNVPGSDEWIQETDSPRMEVFQVAKRTGKFNRWEPIFIGTQSDPSYDDRITWEMQREKMPQAYIMCVLDYDFMILNDGFLVHSPGVKTAVRFSSASKEVNRLFRANIVPELRLLYGTRKGCRL